MAGALSTVPTALAITATTISALFLWIRHKHRVLRSRVRSREVSAAERRADINNNNNCNAIESLPQDLLDRPEDYRIIHEQDSVPLPPSIITTASDDLDEELFTRLMRRNMRLFATYLPQAHLMRLLLANQTPEQKRSFTASHIDRLAFREGDLACGVYRVLVRRPMRCEMGMDSLRGAGLPESFGGRLVTSILLKAEEGDGTGAGSSVLRTETLQWVGRHEGMVLPLERKGMRWMHELASWGLLVSGREWLVKQEAEREQGKKKETI